MEQLGIFFRAKYHEAKKRNEELEHENKMLKNRCAALTEGTMCLFCPYDCENRSTKYRGDK